MLCPCCSLAVKIRRRQIEYSNTDLTYLRLYIVYKMTYRYKKPAIKRVSKGKDKKAKIREKVDMEGLRFKKGRR